MAIEPRVINPEFAGKDRTRLTKAIVLAIGSWRAKCARFPNPVTWRHSSPWPCGPFARIDISVAAGKNAAIG